jgi:hypothetical protein
MRVIGRVVLDEVNAVAAPVVGRHPRPRLGVPLE